MSAFPLTTPLPAPFDPDRAARTFAGLAERGYRPDGRDREILTAAFGNSPYLCRLALRLTDLLPRLFAEGPEGIADECRCAALAADAAGTETEAQRILRRAKAATALTVALADIAGLWPLETVTGTLTDFADAALKGALRFALKEAARNTPLANETGETLEASTGMTVLAMGKYGGRELNYSSDIDLVVFFDAERFPFRKHDDARPAAVAVVKSLVRQIGDITADGYVFRVDLRLRPDPGSTQVAISLDAAREYYEEMGQNWERAAMIKARAAAGDLQTAADFYDIIRPFVWRRSLDFAAIEDIHSIKRQIHAVSGGAEIAVAGHNVKLGRGGIREIEFFVQTQQLILGGRDSALRVPATMAALKALNAQRIVGDDGLEDLSEAYRFLRTLEHRLQMIDDAQTHSIGKTGEAVAHIATFMGFADAGAFSAELIRILSMVQNHYAQLFEREEPLAARGNLVFTGVDHDPETLKTLTEMGFQSPEHVSGAIMTWHRGGTRATHGARARELLTKLVPVLLETLSKTAAPDIAFAQFDRFLTNLPSGVQIFSLFLAHREVLRLIADLMGSAPRLAQHLSRNSATLDALLDRDFYAPLPGRESLVKQLAQKLEAADGYEAVLDETRRYVHERIFRVGVQVIEGIAPAEEAGPAFAAIAESAIAALLPHVEAELAQKAGRVPGGAFGVIAMGKLGGREMTAGSDLDLVFVYDVPAGVEQSDGPAPLPVTVYYARLSQRLIAALTAMTSVGGLYEVDMRLRPSGNKGPVAVSLATFRHYHQSEAWTWERLAMTRARVIAGPPDLRAALQATITETLCRQQDWDKLTGDIREMRNKVAAQYPGKSPWDLKYAPGGLIDLEFLTQTVMLGRVPDDSQLLSTNTEEALGKLAAAGAFAPEDAETLTEAAKLQSALMQTLRIAIDGTLEAATATPGLKALLARAGEAGSFETLQRRLTALQRRAHEIFAETLGV